MVVVSEITKQAGISVRSRMSTTEFALARLRHRMKTWSQMNRGTGFIKCLFHRTGA